MRTHHCNELRESHIGQAVTLIGWVNSARDQGGVIFIDLRDREGVTQCVFRSEVSQDATELSHKLRVEDVVQITGTVEARLKDGDFQPGDRISLVVLGDTALSDTFTVRPGRMLQLPNIPEIALQGVLRSEFPVYLKGKLLQYLKDPQVTATPLVRLAVLGAVNRPGFYVMPATTLASDVVMAAGGPASVADISKATVRRGTVPVIDSKQMRQAFADGVSIDQLNLHSGDEILIGEKSGGIKDALRTAGLVSGIILGIFALTRI